ncbi:hypothetical protein [uncultured Gammaproteobacteria bacterium]|uniref:hypothetical protein n=1 Tax=Bathymodiolus heckerae thiotrophic gill symbiont TaxID=1052212 RepID=UPI0010B5CEA9|nr:hypothetical protein [Bathymodiolus heckerae thiotrophic gill symbiont]CAC9435232.1 hypothetical protein [uncultured Gammaproteobacteria bacterium]CAC9437289.1 hypothetical protein [uncultured Gammaproteobacteria bacterium]SMN14032.1 hypothetical protein BHECKSOX2_1304 [Bathymodiolus heckerae thiotrophic gill symbiont]
MSNIKKQLKAAIRIAKKAEIEALIATKKAQKAVEKIEKLKKSLELQHKELTKKIKKTNDKKIKLFSKKRIKKAKKKENLK